MSLNESKTRCCVYKLYRNAKQTFEVDIIFNQFLAVVRQTCRQVVPAFLSVRLRFITVTVVFDSRAIPYSKLIFKIT